MNKSERIINAHVTAIMEERPYDNERYFLIIWNTPFHKQTLEVFQTRKARDVYFELHFKGPEVREYEEPQKAEVFGEQLTNMLPIYYHPQFH